MKELCAKYNTIIDAGAFVITGHCTQAGFKDVLAPPFEEDFGFRKLLSCSIKEFGSHVKCNFGSLGSVDAYPPLTRPPSFSSYFGLLITPRVDISQLGLLLEHQRFGIGVFGRH